MKIGIRKALAIIATSLLTVLFMGSLAADREAVVTENYDGGDCTDGVVENLITGQPIQVWSKDGELDAIEITNDGEEVDSDFFFHGSCDFDRGRGSRTKSDTYYLHLVCAELVLKKHGQPESYRATGLLVGPRTVGSDSFRYDGFEFGANSTLNDCCTTANDNVPGAPIWIWTGEMCIVPAG